MKQLQYAKTRCEILAEVEALQRLVSEKEDLIKLLRTDLNTKISAVEAAAVNIIVGRLWRGREVSWC